MAVRPEGHDGGGEGVSAFRAWLSVGILLLLTMVSFMDRSIIALMVDPIKQDLGVSDVQISLLKGLAFVSLYSIVGLPMGWVADRYSRRWLIYFGASGWSLSTVACGLARTYGQLFAARVAVGAGEATLTPAAYSIMADLFPKRRLSFAVGVLAAGMAVGGGVAIAVGGFVVEEAHKWSGLQQFAPWQVAFMVVGAPGLLLAPLVFLIPRTKRPAVVGGPVFLAAAPNYLEWVGKRARYLFCFAFGAGLHGALAYGLASWTAVYLSRHFHLSPSQVGMTLAPITSIFSVMGFVGGGWLVDRMHASGVRDAHFRYFVFNCIAITICGVAAFTVVKSMGLLLVLLAVIHLLLPFTGPAVGHLQMSTPQAFRGRTMAIYMLILNFVGMGLGPTVVALFSDKLLGGPQHIGGGLALMFAVLGPVSVALFLFALRPARAAIASAQEADAAVLGARPGSQAPGVAPGSRSSLAGAGP
jgi:MFS family permease